MSRRTNIEAAHSFVLSAVFVGSVAYVAARASIAIADGLVRTGSTLPVEVLTVAGAPLAAILAGTSITRMARASSAPRHKSLAAVFGGMAVTIPLMYVTVFDDGMVSYKAPQAMPQQPNQEHMIPEPPTGGLFKPV